MPFLTLALQQVADVVLSRIDGMIDGCGRCLCLEEVVNQAHGAGGRCLVRFVIALAFFGMCVVRLLCEAEDGFPSGHEDGGPSQCLVVGRGVHLVKSLKEQDACYVEVGMLLCEGKQMADSIFVDGVGAPDVVYEVSLHVLLVEA